MCLLKLSTLLNWLLSIRGFLSHWNTLCADMHVIITDHYIWAHTKCVYIYIYRHKSILLCLYAFKCHLLQLWSKMKPWFYKKPSMWVDKTCCCMVVYRIVFFISNLSWSWSAEINLSDEVLWYRTWQRQLYRFVFLTWQKLSVFLVSIFELSSLVYKFILSQDLQIVVLATFFFMPTIMFSNIRHALNWYYLIILNVIRFLPGNKAPTF